MAAGPDLPVRPGEVLAGKYRVEKILGAGGMGVVVAATHLDLGEPRAVKFMLPSGAGDSVAVERFFREARAAARLKSDHVARVHDVGRMDDGVPYIVMEQLEGTDLGRLLKKDGPLPAAAAIDYVLQACDALAEAHAAGIVHRDLKPANLFLADDADGSRRVKLLDFGISKLSDAESVADITGTDAMIGSPFHMSPEQMRSSRDVDHRTDIWSLGVILYQLVTGAYPFKGDNRLQVMLAVSQEPPGPLSAYRVDVPKPLAEAIFRCLEKERERRFSDVSELAVAIAPFAVAPETTVRLQRIARLTERARAAGSVLAADKTNPTAATAQPSQTPAVTDGPTDASWGRTGGAARSSNRVRALSYVAVALAAIGVGVVSTRLFGGAGPQPTPSGAPLAAEPEKHEPASTASSPTTAVASSATGSASVPEPNDTADVATAASASSSALARSRSSRTGTPRPAPPAPVRESPRAPTDPWGNARK